VTTIDSATLTPIATTTVGNAPLVMALDDRRGRLYTANANDGTVSVIDTFSMTVLATLPVGQYPDAIAVEPRSGCVYVANAASSTVSVVACDGALSRATLGSPIGDLEWTTSGRSVGLA
jgi:YVTN family beta-propeller protein